MPEIHVHFDSLAAVVEAARHAPEGFDARDKSKNRWAGGSLEKASTLASRGWPEGSEKAKRILARIHETMPHENVHSGTYNDVTGAYCDVGLYVQGIPECMVEFCEDKRRARFASIIVSASYSAMFTPEEAINRGVAIAAAIDKLEDMAIRCDVRVIMRARAGDRYLQVSVTVKESHEPLDLDRLVYAVAHPTYLRRLMFGIMEQQPPDVRDVFGIMPGRGYGSPAKMPRPAGSIVFETPSRDDDWSEAGALVKANEAVATFVESQK